jgi:hypothetical protein
VRCAAVGLAFALVALAAPRAGAARARWTVVENAAAHLELPVRDGGPARRSVALGECDAWLARAGAERGEPLAVEEFSAWDAPGVIWLVARPPEPAPRHAAWFASGGESAPGVVARGADGARRVRWWFDGERVRVEDDPEPARTFALAPEAPEPVRELARLWAEQHGFAEDEGAERRLVCARATGDGPAVVGLADGPDPAGELDPQAIAIAWSRVFDAAWDTDGVPIAARSAPGDGSDRAPGAEGDPRQRATRFTWLCAALAAACALAAAIAFDRGSSGRRAS